MVINDVNAIKSNKSLFLDCSKVACYNYYKFNNHNK